MGYLLFAVWIAIVYICWHFVVKVAGARGHDEHKGLARIDLPIHKFHLVFLPIQGEAEALRYSARSDRIGSVEAAR